MVVNAEEIIDIVADKGLSAASLEIANILKEWIQSWKFELTEKIQPLPGVDSGQGFKPLKERLE